jgi:hypothetical protein
MNRKQRALKRFVEEIYEVYKAKARVSRLAIASNPSTRDVGNDGEYIAQLYLEELGYIASLSPESKTPADVYGIKEYGDFFHIASIQAKTTHTNEKAKSLSILEKTKLTRLPKEVAQIYFDSRHAGILNPFDLPLAITADYMGIVNDDIDEMYQVSMAHSEDISPSKVARELKAYYL